MKPTAATMRLRAAVVTVVVFVVLLMGVEAWARVVFADAVAPARFGASGIDAAVGAVTDADQPAVVLLGSSMMGSAVRPGDLAVLPPGTVSAAFDGGSPRLYELLWSDVVSKSASPSVVVIGLSSRDFNFNGVRVAEDLYDRYFESPGRHAARGEAGASERIESWLGERSVFIRHRASLRTPRRFAESVWGSDEADDAETFRITEGFTSLWLDRNLAGYSFSAVESDALLALIAELGDDTDVVLIDMPVVEDVVVPLHPHGAEDWQAYQRGLEELAAATGARLVSANRALSWTRDDFVDAAHLNSHGARRFSEWLAGVLADHDS